MRSVDHMIVRQAIIDGMQHQPTNTCDYAFENYIKRCNYNWKYSELTSDDLKLVLIGGGHEPWAHSGKKLGELIEPLKTFLSEPDHGSICDSCKALPRYIETFKAQNQDKPEPAPLGTLILYKEIDQETKVITFGYCDGMHRMMAILMTEYPNKIPVYIGFDPRLDETQSSSW